jgi:hypothetical protein
MFCANCGIALPAEYQHCTACGHRVSRGGSNLAREIARESGIGRETHKGSLLIVAAGAVVALFGVSALLDYRATHVAAQAQPNPATALSAADSGGAIEEGSDFSMFTPDDIAQVYLGVADLEGGNAAAKLADVCARYGIRAKDPNDARVRKSKKNFCTAAILAKHRLSSAAPIVLPAPEYEAPAGEYVPEIDYEAQLDCDICRSAEGALSGPDPDNNFDAERDSCRRCAASQAVR